MYTEDYIEIRNLKSEPDHLSMYNFIKSALNYHIIFLTNIKKIVVKKQPIDQELIDDIDTAIKLETDFFTNITSQTTPFLKIFPGRRIIVHNNNDSFTIKSPLHTLSKNYFDGLKQQTIKQIFAFEIFKLFNN